MTNLEAISTLSTQTVVLRYYCLLREVQSCSENGYYQIWGKKCTS